MATPNRDKLAEELIKLRKVYEPYEARDREICAELKRLALDESRTVGPIC
jgi:hypothetical protein